MTDTLPKGGALVAALMRGGPNYKQGYSFANALGAVIEREILTRDTESMTKSQREATEVAILARDTVLEVLNDHIPSLDEDTEEMLVEMAADLGNTDVSDLAKRTCACGEHIDGFYAYVSHLREIFGEKV